MAGSKAEAHSGKAVPELLSPAGNMESLIGVLNAGADAVYLGGDKFNARAYADNFTTQQLLEALDLAHLQGKRIYLTLNTLLKEREFGEVYDYVAPLYEAGLDGVIVQDFGVLAFCREYFPGMELHASTQMTVTGSKGVRLLQRHGVCRVVPARELSLRELAAIKRETGVTLETFIHGAICYCYSGQCLFSSFLGGRSGNRGRCAQPCRLPYQMEGQEKKKEQYPLSLKDMCMIEQLPKLIEAGIDSFKIEGRMKRPEYAAGVTALYRKYLDLYRNEPQRYRVARGDLEMLSGLYLRSGRSEGYYFRRNGREMVTLEQPGYAGTDENALRAIRERYLDRPLPGTAVAIRVDLRAGEAAVVEIGTDGEERLRICGSSVQEAQTRPLTEAQVRRQFEKLGGTPFVPAEFSCMLDGDVFLSVGEMNRLRREAAEGLRRRLLLAWRRKAQRPGRVSDADGGGGAAPETEKAFTVSVRLPQQLAAIERYLRRNPDECRIGTLYVPEELWLTDRARVERLKKRTACFLRLPAITRGYPESTRKLWGECDGVLACSLEQLEWLREEQYGRPVVAEHSLYAWNRAAYRFLAGYADRITYPLELNGHEKKELGGAAFEQVIYGRTALMHTANCVQKTYGDCCRKSETGADEAREEDGVLPMPAYSSFTALKDRRHKTFPVFLDCFHCMNVIYNSVPLSLHGFFPAIWREGGAQRLRLEFTDEDGEALERILAFFLALADGGRPDPPFAEYTNGHEKSGVE